MSCVRGCCRTQHEHYRSVVVRPIVSARAVQEKTEAADMAAYQRLRRDGVQPKAIEGAAVLERDASSPIEVERNYVIRNDRLRRELEQAHRNAPPPLPPSAA